MSRRQAGGFTLLEMMFVLALTVVAAMGLTRMMQSSLAIERYSRVDVLLERELRAGLLSIADVLRNVPEAELGGFDMDEKTVRPTFQRITSSSDGVAALGASAYLEWQATASGRSDDPGGVYLVEGTASTLVASKITAGSFQIHREGESLRIEIEARRATGEGDAIRTRAGQIVVALRN